MATINPRINITLPGETAAVLRTASKQNKKPVSKVALELIEWAIEEREDFYFSKIADERMRSKPKFVADNDKIWN